MIKFITPHYLRYPNSIHIGYHQTAQDIILDAGNHALVNADPTLQTLWDEHLALLADERTMDMYNLEEQNAEIGAALTAMDNQWSIVRSLLDIKERQPATVAAATRIKNAVKALDYSTNKPAAAQEAVTLAFRLACLPNGELKADADACGIQAEVGVLETLRLVLRAKLDVRRQMEESRPAASTKEVRKEVDANLTEMFRRIEGLQDFGATADVKAAAGRCAADVNVLTEDSNRRYDRKHKSLKGHVVTDGFPGEMPYTGQPVTPAPDKPVYYVETDHTGDVLEEIELFFGKDYDIFYRGNVKKGKAYIIVRGKGYYTGTEEFPFEIV
jgi:hypothetical protein